MSTLPTAKIHPTAILDEGVVIGSLGFGYKTDEIGIHHYRDHKFGVVIGPNVYIGANTCIDRGRWRDTIIGEGTKIDNLCHIAHNVQIGRNCLIAPNVTILGSVTIADNVKLWSSSTINQGVSIGEGAVIGACSYVRHDVPDGETWYGNPARKVR